MDDLQIGKTYHSKSYGDFVLLESTNYHNNKIKFVQTGYERIARKDKILSGAVKDPMLPTIEGVGYLGSGEHKAWENNADTPVYLCWVSMIRRCYSKRVQRLQPTYIGCTVTPEWHNFQNFAKILII
jgi:hypothetical protein